MFDAAGERREPGVVGRTTEHAGERRPSLVVVDRDRDPRIVADAPVAALGRQPRQAVAGSRRHGAGEHVVEQERPEARHGRLELGDVDHRALAGPVTMFERREDRGEGVETGEVVGWGDRGDARRHLVGVAGQLVEPDERCLVRTPREELVVRLVRIGAEAGQGDVDEAGIDRAQVVGTETEGADRRRRVVGDEHVGRRRSASAPPAAPRAA